MIEIRVTGGYVGELTVELRDKKGADLSTAGIKILLLLENTALPVRGSGSWKTPSSASYVSGAGNGGVSVAKLTLTVDDTVAIGDYYAWALSSLSPTAVPVRANNEVVRIS